MDTMAPEYVLDSKSVRRTPSYAEVFGKEITSEEIQIFISELDMYSSISIICELLSLRNKQISRDSHYLWWDFSIKVPFDCALKHLFLQNCYENKATITSEGLSLLNPYDTSTQFITLQSLLISLKLLLAYGNYDSLSEKDSISSDDYCKILKLSLIATGTLDVEHLNPNHFIYGNYHLNQINNIGNEILRAYEVYCVIGGDRSKFSAEVQKEYLDFNSDFTAKYGYTISDYLTVLFLLSERDVDENAQLLYRPIYRDLAVSYENCKDPDTAKTIIRTLSVDFSGIKEWALDTLQSWWDFSVFMEKPIILLPNDHFTSICDRTLINGLYEKLFWHIRGCYAEDDRKLNSFIGRPFEQYVQAITKAAVMVNGTYSYQPEFYFSTPESGHNASSDAYIIKDNKMIVVEAKSYGPLYDSIMYCDDESIQKSIEKLFVKPVIQAEKISRKIIEETDSAIFDNVDELIVLSITVDSVQAVPDYYNKAIRDIFSKVTLEKIKYCLNLNIREFEFLLSMVENGIDIFHVIESYLSQPLLRPFVAYAMELTGHSFIRTQYMEQIFKECSASLHDSLF